MDHKNLIATLYLKDGMAVKGRENFEKAGELKSLISLYNNNGVDKLYVIDLSDTEEEHEINLQTIKKMCRVIEIPMYGAGNIHSFDDIKRILYAGCKGVILNSAKSGIGQLMKEGAQIFGKENMLLSMENVDYIFKHKQEVEKYVHKLVVLNEYIVSSLKDIIKLPYSVITEGYDKENWVKILKNDSITGIGGDYISSPDTDVTALKRELAAEGIETKKFVSSMQWQDFKLNSDGLLPVIVQHYLTGEVLMMAYMNEEAFKTTLFLGKMTYYSRSRRKLWIKGETSGHYQYVKSLTIDCDKDTLLAKVSQVGQACHTGNPTCFFQELVKEEYVKKNPLKVFENKYAKIKERKNHPKEGSYINKLLDKGIDNLLKEVCEESAKIVISAKNYESDEMKYEISDLLYQIMVLMVEYGISWEDIMEELNQR